MEIILLVLLLQYLIYIRMKIKYILEYFQYILYVRYIRHVWLLFSRTIFYSWKQKTLKTCLIKEVVFFFFIVSCVLKMALFREQKKGIRKWLFFVFFFSLFSHFLSSSIVKVSPTAWNEGNSTNASVFSFYFYTYWSYFW